MGCAVFPTVGVAPIPNASANAGSSALHEAVGALDAGARVVVQQTKLYAEAEAIEAIGVGLEHLMKLDKVHTLLYCTTVHCCTRSPVRTQSLVLVLIRVLLVLFCREYTSIHTVYTYTIQYNKFTNLEYNILFYRVTISYT